jgi:hypothetical protein
MSGGATLREQLEATRERADRARRLAASLTLDRDRAPLVRHAEELEALVKALEHQMTLPDAGGRVKGPPATHRQLRPQQQRQQTSRIEPAASDGKMPED